MSSSSPTATSDVRGGVAYKVARIVTEILAPWAVIVMLAAAMAWRATGYHLGLAALWAAIVVVFSAAVPMAVITRGARAGRWDGHHVRNREGRLVPFLTCLGSTGLGLVVMTVGRAPQAMIAMALVMLAVLVVTGAVTTRWKISMHTSVAGGGVAMLALLYNPMALLLLVVVAVIGWSRVVLRDHTAAQVVVGGVAGFLVSALVFVVVS